MFALKSNLTMYEQLKLDNQLCFSPYSLSKQITKQIVLNAIDLTYPQYLVMMVLWRKTT